MGYVLPERHRHTAARIPRGLRSSLSAAEILGRCEQADALLKTAGSFSDPITAREFMTASDAMLTDPHAVIPPDVLAAAQKSVEASAGWSSTIARDGAVITQTSPTAWRRVPAGEALLCKSAGASVESERAETLTQAASYERLAGEFSHSDPAASTAYMAKAVQLRDSTT